MEECDFVVGFRRETDEGVLAGWLKYRLEDAAGQPLLSRYSPSDGSRRYLVVKNLKPSQRATVNYSLVLPRGQFSAPGSFQDGDIGITLHQRSPSGAIKAPPEDSGSLIVVQNVKASVGVSIAGGGIATTLNFGDLAEGKERLVSLNAVANYAYSLRLKSRNHSMMKLDPVIDGQNWTIPYSLQINSEPVSLDSDVKLRRLPPSLSLGRESHLLKFRIGETRDRMAGLYRDVVTIEIGIEP
jgi:hypothetical protein